MIAYVPSVCKYLFHISKFMSILALLTSPTTPSSPQQLTGFFLSIYSISLHPWCFSYAAVSVSFFLLPLSLLSGTLPLPTPAFSALLSLSALDSSGLCYMPLAALFYLQWNLLLKPYCRVLMSSVYTHPRVNPHHYYQYYVHVEFGFLGWEQWKS